MSVLSSQRKALRVASSLARPRARFDRRRGITLIEAALVLSLTGVLLAAFVPTFLRQVHTSKLAEATELLASLHRHAALYYEHEQAASAGLRRGCLPVSAGPYPPEPSVDPVQVDFQADPLGKQTWSALGQNRTSWLRYSYEVSTPEPGCDLPRTRSTMRGFGVYERPNSQATMLYVLNSILERSK